MYVVEGVTTTTIPTIFASLFQRSWKYTYYLRTVDCCWVECIYTRLDIVWSCLSFPHRLVHTERKREKKIKRLATRPVEPPITCTNFDARNPIWSLFYLNSCLQVRKFGTSVHAQDRGRKQVSCWVPRVSYIDQQNPVLKWYHFFHGQISATRHRSQRRKWLDCRGFLQNSESLLPSVSIP